MQRKKRKIHRNRQEMGEIQKMRRKMHRKWKKMDKIRKIHKTGRKVHRKCGKKCLTYAVSDESGNAQYSDDGTSNTTVDNQHKAAGA